MPEATRDIHDSHELAGRAEATVSEPRHAPATTAVDAGLHPVEPAAPRTASDSPETPDTAEAPSPNVPAPPDAVPAPQDGATPPSDQATDEDLAQAVERLLTETPPAPATPEPAAPVAAAAQSGQIESLDQELASLADDLIAGEIASENQLLAQEAAQEAEQAAAVAAAAPTPEAAPPEPQPMPDAEAAAPEPAPEPQLAIDPPTAPVVEPPPRVAETPETPPAAPMPAAAPARPALLVRAMAMASAPLRDRPPHVRQMVGWVALVQAFLALCVWGYLLLIRPTQAVPPAAPAVKDTKVADGYSAAAAKPPKPSASKKTASTKAPAGKPKAQTSHH